MALDSSQQNGVGFSSSCTLAHAIGGGSNRVLFVYVTAQTSTTSYVSGVTYNGVAMTQASFSPQSFGNTAWLFYMKESSLPSAGTYDVVVSTTGAGAFEAQSVSWDGVDQTTPIANNNGSNNGTYSIPASDSITTPSGSYAIDWLCQFTTTNATTPGAGQTEIRQGTTQYRISSSYKQDATAMSHSWSSGQISGNHMVISLNLASVAPADRSQQTKLGVHQGVGSQPHYFYGG